MVVGGDLSEQKQEAFTLKELTGFFFFFFFFLHSRSLLGFFFSFENKQIVCWLVKYHEVLWGGK